MQREREHEAPRRRPAPAAPLDLDAPGDAAAAARHAAAGAAAVETGSAGIQVRVKASPRDTVALVATPDTPLAELMERACSELGVEDSIRYALVAGGEVLADGSRTLGSVTQEIGVEQELDMRLVRKPEAGAPTRAAG